MTAQGKDQAGQAAGAERSGERVLDVVIIGSGPAGYTAAIYTARANLKPVVFEGAVSAGGALMTTTEVENFPGFPEGIQGPELMENLRAQAERFGAELIADDVTEVDLAADPKVVKVGDETYLARSVIVATGSAYKKLGVEHEDRLLGRGVSACATCDGFFFRDQDIAVVGGGDSALEEATFLTRFAKSVTIVHRRDKLRASAIMQERAFANPKVRFRWNAVVEEVLGEDKVTGVRLRDTVTDKTDELAITGLFVAIGHLPRTDLIHDQLELDGEGYIKVAHPTTQTNIAGVFACGDVVDHTYRQAITAAGTGCSAALDAERYIASLEGAADSAAEAPRVPAPELAATT
ncbi:MULTISPECIES: thioredoxin-disulfide reductase [Parafrankia]|uniref:thioredoxin-disulfide reductase n=1 Tax=Parafrankia TaxID=2994362 RepID=UPI0009F68853|nr:MULTISPECIES: thioredoxin-disulfide reductase [Parafrankia]TCJ35389.1 thioredoxin-disulfide reductase [Parafrankia sp. BMG5.11]SQD98665.1 thioredoxin reductase, FAD/NAD(P)-binding [Parafrankia sp. Ea1.12]